MTAPRLVTPPAGLPVSLADMKDYRRAIGYTDDDAQLDALQASAVAYLDGWGGVLGRCIMPQTWALDVTGPGDYLLPFPDASSIAASAGTVTSKLSGRGVTVTLTEVDGDEEVAISAEYGLSAQRLPAAQVLVKLIVGGWFEHREALSDRNLAALPMSVTALIAALRWDQT